jgi:hypothetical protein
MAVQMTGNWKRSEVTLVTLVQDESIPPDSIDARCHPRIHSGAVSADQDSRPLTKLTGRDPRIRQYT